jgi:hypothetical protein
VATAKRSLGEAFISAWSKVISSVPYPKVFGPPGSGSVIICTDLDPGPDLSTNNQKIYEKPYFQLFSDFLMTYYL